MRTLIIMAFIIINNPFLCAEPTIDAKLDNLLNGMSLDQKIGQMTQLNITTIIQDSLLKDYSNVKHFVLDTAKLVNYVKNWHVGSFFNGRAVDPANWVYVTGTVQRINAQYSPIPILYGIDHMHGASYLKNGTIFPHNINIGCSFDR